MKKKINDPWSTKKVENDFTTSAYSEGEKNETFSVTREKTRAHRSFLNPEARESTEISSRDSLGRFLSTGRWKISNSAKCSNVVRREFF